MSCSCRNTGCTCMDDCLCCPEYCLTCQPCREIRSLREEPDPWEAFRRAANVSGNRIYKLKGTYRKMGSLHPQLHRSGEGPDSRSDSPTSRESDEDELMFQMDDIDGPVSKKSPMLTSTTSSHFSSSTIVSNTSERTKVYDYSHQNRDSGSKPRETCVTEMSLERISNESLSNRTDSREMSIVNDLPCSSNPKSDTQGESQVTDGASCVISSPSDKYSSDSLPSGLSSDDPPSETSVHSNSPVQILSASAPSLFDLPEPSCSSKSLKENAPLSVNTPEPSASNLPELETLRLSDSQPVKKERAESSSSIQTLPEDASNEENKDLSGNSIIPAIFIDSSSLQTESVQTNSQAATSDSIKSQNLEKEKLDSTSSESSSSIEVLSGDGISSDEAYFE